MWPRVERYGSQRQDNPCRSGGSGPSCSSSAKSTALDQLIGELETAAGEHGEAVAGAELMLGNEHVPPAPPQFLNRNQA